MQKEILSIKNISKSFAGVRALDDVSLLVRAGEVHALMGENGAGKSTLIKILTGIYKADAGEITFDGKVCAFKNTLEAQHAGLNAIYQELNMAPYLTVSENIFISQYPTNISGINWSEMHRQAQKLVDDIGVDIDVRKPLRSYGTAKQQIVAILRAVNMQSKLIVMDEPTSSLDSNEVEILFSIMDKLKKDGIAVIFISHRLDEVYKKSDRISVLKDGHYVGTFDTGSLSQYELLTKMIGKKELEQNVPPVDRDFSLAPCVLEARNLSRMPYVQDVSLRIHKGEVLGLAGLLGSGRTEVARLLFGCDNGDGGDVLVNGEVARIKSPEDAVRLGMAFCTENRREEGIFPNVTVQNNIVFCALPKLTRFGIIDRKKCKALSREYIKKLSIKTPSDEQLIKNLSGGNQQKVILSRWLATEPQMIILDEPTRGIDVGAKAEIEKLIREFSERGISVLFISSEMAELVRNCDRILVLRDGAVKGELAGKNISEDNIMRVIANKSQNTSA